MALCHYDWVATGFAYRTDTNDYEVVKFSSFCAFEADTEAMVYTLSSNSWKKIGISLRLNNIESFFVTSTSTTFVSGALHWLGYTNKAE